MTENPLVLLRPTLNPYRRAIDMAARRILWDFNLESWRSRAKLRRLKDQYNDRRAVILCNGPSLNRVDFGMLDGVFCFGLNKINLIFDRTSFRPDCIVAVNSFVIEQNAEFYNKTDLPLFISSAGVRNVRPRQNVSFIHTTDIQKFARDVTVSVFEGYTVTFVALQIAFHLGFRDVALVGADHNFATKGPANTTVVSGEKDESHFDPRYFSGGVKWQLPDLFQSEVAYTMARDVYDAFGRKIVNATDGGNLEVFERQSLSDFIYGIR